MADQDDPKVEGVETAVQNEQPDFKPVDNETPNEPFATVEGMPEGGITPPPTEPVMGRMRHRATKRERIIIAVLVAGFAAAGVWYWTQHKPKTAQTNTQPAAEQPLVIPEPKQDEYRPPKAVTLSESDQKLLAKVMNPTTGETWLPTRKQLPDQKFYKPTADGQLPTYQYFDVGARAGNKIVIAISEEGIGQTIEMFEKSADGKAALISRPHGGLTYNAETDQEKYFSSNYAAIVSLDKTTHYDSLSYPSKLDVGNGYTASFNWDDQVYFYFGETIQDDSGSTQIKQIGQSTLRRYERMDSVNKLTAISYNIKTPINTSIGLRYEPLPLKLDGYTWQRGASSAAGDIVPISSGCGIGVSVSRAEGFTDAQSVLAGSSTAGNKLYEAKDLNNMWVTKAYQEFKDAVKDVPSDTPQYKYKDVSKEEFAKQHAVLFFKDNLGQWLSYIRTDFRLSGGCAKPVVYLYPTQPQRVNVRVGADVKVSDPVYNASTGWDAFAFPNGLLVANGGVYSSLFWEGPGQGHYPALQGGTVVKRENAVSTMRAQLEQQGLNTREIDDFLAYWTDKIPSSNYVRLSWLTTNEMNQLAPLAITPRPDTLIRVFLDMEGLNQPIALPAQQLKAIPRTGFTVVEWGGLSLSKLY